MMTRQQLIAKIQRYHWFALAIVWAFWIFWIVRQLLGSGPFDVDDILLSMDHLAFYTPAKMIADGEVPLANIYDYTFVFDYQKGLFADRKWASLEAFRNPPFYALLYVPTANWSYGASATFWNIVGLLSLALGIRLVTPHSRGKAFLHALGFVPILAVMTFGQNSLLSFGLFAVVYALIQRQRYVSAGVVAGLLAFKPTLLIGLTVWGILEVRQLWRCALGGLACIAVLVGASYAIVPEAWVGFWNNLPDNLKFDAFEWWKCHTPRAFFRLLFPELANSRWETGATLVGFLLGVFWFFQLWRKHRQNLPVMYGAVVLLTLWGSPHALIYEWSLAFLTALLWWFADQNRQKQWVIPMSVTWLALANSTDICRIWVWLMEHYAGHSPTFLVQISVPVLLWFGWRSLQIWNQEPMSQQTPKTLG